MARYAFSIRPAGAYRLDLTTWALRRRRANAIDRFDGRLYHRVLVIGSEPALLTLRQAGSQDEPILRAVVEGPDSAIGNHKRLKELTSRLLGTAVDTEPFYKLAEGDPFLAEFVRFRGFRPPRFASIYEALINAICFQQLSLQVGVVLMNRLAQMCGLMIETEHGRFHSLPEPQALMRTSMKTLLELGFSNNKTKALLELAERAATDSKVFDIIANSEDEDAIAELETFRGIGRWSAEYVLLRGLGRLHIFPGDDIGFQNSLARLLKLSGRPKPLETRHIVEKWYPYGGMVYFQMLLARNEEGFTDEER
jgi:DNA-3-methyladenine glycosylase II